MATIPGSAGLPLLGDKSYDFYKDPIKFQNKHMENTKSRTFLSRFLNKPTIFIGSNKLLREVLTEHEKDMEFGYKMFMEEIYGENILFADDDFAEGLRESLSHLFTPDVVETYQDTINRIVQKSFADLDTGEPICVYKFFKRLTMEICLSLFLGLDFSHNEAEVISQLTTTHWHGIISVPVAIKLPKMSESTYSKALDAKKKLLTVIHKRREEKCHMFPQRVEKLPNFEEDHRVNNHLLLFTSALVPKGLASILTSFVTEMGKDERVNLQDMLLENADLYDGIMMEVLRLYPPFLGGRRVITKEFTAGGYKFPAGHAVLYLTYAAQRDPAIFDNPNEFKSGRWQSINKDDRDKLSCFGSGPRACLGQQLIWKVVRTALTQMIKRFRFTLEPGQDLTHKWLPVSRPQGNVLVRLQPRVWAEPGEQTLTETLEKDLNIT